MISERAEIHPGAKLGVDVTVGPFTFIGDNVEIGDGCTIGPNVTLLPYTTIGRDCEIHAGAVLGDLPQDTEFRGEPSYLRIGSGCRIREGASIHRGTKPGTATEIGDGCFLMGFTHFAHNVKLGREVIVVNGSLLAGYVEVGDKAFVSGNCLVHQFTRVGRLAMLGGGCGISKDCPPFCTVRPLSRNRVAGLNVVGMRRAGMKPEERTAVKQAFHTLYRTGMNISQAVEALRGDEHAAVVAFREFIAASRRGLCGLEGGDGGTA